jgi:NTE family protein
MKKPAFRPVSLALGGGAALGWAHIGVVNVLQARGVPIAAVAGTSIGAVVAVAVAGNKLPELEKLARSASMRTILGYLDVAWRSSGGMLGGKVIERQLNDYFGDMTLEDLAIPCATLAADLMTGKEVAIRTGSVVKAVRASLSLPGIFTPHLHDGMLLGDGGLVNPVPVNIARQLSAAPVIAVNLQGDYSQRSAAAGLSLEGKQASMMKISRLSLGLILAALSEKTLALHPPDLMIAPAIGTIDVGDFRKADELIRLGRVATEEAWPRIAALLGPHPDGASVHAG